MRQEFTDTLHRLETEPKFAISVTNTDTNKSICRNKTKKALEDQYGSVKNFFDDVHNKGNINIGINTRYRNGTSNLHGPIPYYTLKFGDGDEKPLNAPSKIYHEKPVQEMQPKIVSGMMSLGFPEALELYSKANSKDTTEVELTYAKKRIEDLEKTNAEYREEIFQNRNSREEAKEKRELNQSLIGTILNSPAVEIVFNKFFGGVVEPTIETAQSLGLGNPNLSPLQNEIIEAISKSSEQTVDLLGKVFDGFSNAEFTNQLIESLKNHNLWQQSQEELQ
jgi:hypothetical protein